MTILENEIREKYQRLLDAIRVYQSAAVAFSGGVDSTLLVCAAAYALGPQNVVCVTARSASFPERELQEAVAFCQARGIRHEIVDSEELDIDGFADNPPNRCYLCKHELFSKIGAFAKSAGLAAVFEGSNADDAGDYRPGMQAVSELGIKSPLRETGLNKDDIREISKALDLPTWNKQSFACLSSRFVYGETITAEKLGMIDKAEQFLLDKGFRFVRVRIHGQKNYIARVEVLPEDIAKLAADPLRGEISDCFKKLGFAYTALDLAGYRTGSMNEGLSFETGERVAI